MSTLHQLEMERVELANRHTEQGLAQYAKRRRWSRTDSARWLDERSEAGLARLRRLGRECPQVSRRLGHWLKEDARDTQYFGHIHAALAALPNDTARECAHVLDILK